MKKARLNAGRTIKEKDYQFIYRQHIVESEITNENPLLDMNINSDDEGKKGRARLQGLKLGKRQKVKDDQDSGLEDDENDEDGEEKGKGEGGSGEEGEEGDEMDGEGEGDEFEEDEGK